MRYFISAESSPVNQSLSNYAHGIIDTDVIACAKFGDNLLFTKNLVMAVTKCPFHLQKQRWPLQQRALPCSHDMYNIMAVFGNCFRVTRERLVSPALGWGVTRGSPDSNYRILPMLYVNSERSRSSQSYRLGRFRDQIQRQRNYTQQLCATPMTSDCR